MENISIDVDLFEKLSNMFGPSGFEHEIQKFVKEYGEQYADEVLFDNTGSVIFKYGQTGPKVMITGHSDECGFMVNEITDDGFLKLIPLGGWWEQVLLGHQLRVRPLSGKPDVIGILGAKPPHVLTTEDRKKIVKLKDMYLDVGCQSAKGVEDLGIEIGDAAVPETKFRLEKRNFYKKTMKNPPTEEKEELTVAFGKAFDDRQGLLLILELLKFLKENNIHPPNQLFFIASVQEEVGLRGARTSAQLIKPDLGIALEAGLASDVPGAKGWKSPLNGGIAMDVMDYYMIANPLFRRYCINLCKELDLEYQVATMMGGGTDAGAIHLTHKGAPSICLATATRHVHSHCSITVVEDLAKLKYFLIELVQCLNQSVIQDFIIH